MSEKIKKRIIDAAAGIELTPEKPDTCLGNGEQGLECCCDECDYYLLCFSTVDWKSGEENFAANNSEADRERLL